MRQHDNHDRKYAAFLKGLQVYMRRLQPGAKTPSAVNDNAALLAYRNGPPAAGLQTNWTTTPSATSSFDPENDVDEAGYAAESRHEIRPSPELIMSGLTGIEFREFRHARSGDRGATELVPLPGDLVEYGTHVDEKGNEHRVVTRLGRWRFSNGEQTEWASKRRDKKVIETRIKMPAGAMLGTREEANQPRGSEGSHAGSKSYFESMLGAKHRYLKGGTRSKGKSYSRIESAAMLADAIGNTAEMPPVTKCEPGIASGGNYRPRDLFIGMQKTTCAGGGAMNWQDAIDADENRKEWFRWVASLGDEDRSVLDVAKTARSFADVGYSLGFTGNYARKAGKRALAAANDSAREAMKKVG